MEIERNYFIMLLHGFYMCKYPNRSGKDHMIHVDNHLIANNNPPLTEEEKKLVVDLYDQFWVSLKMDGYNRQNIRRVVKKK